MDGQVVQDYDVRRLQRAHEDLLRPDPKRRPVHGAFQHPRGRGDRCGLRRRSGSSFPDGRAECGQTPGHHEGRAHTDASCWSWPRTRRETPSAGGTPRLSQQPTVLALPGCPDDSLRQDETSFFKGRFMRNST